MWRFSCSRRARVDPPERVAGLVREPQPTVGAVFDVERSFDLWWPAECLHRGGRTVCVRVDTSDRVGARIGKPNAVVGSEPNAVRRRQQRGCEQNGARGWVYSVWIEVKERVRVLNCQPDPAAGI